MKHLYVAIALIVAPAVVPAQDVEVADVAVRAEVERATAAVLDSLMAALGARDARRVAAVYARGASVHHVSGARIIQTDTITPYTARGLAALEAFDAQWTAHNLQVLSPTVAVRTIRLTFRMTPRSQPTEASSGVQTLVFKRLRDGWKIVADQRTMETQ